MSMRCGNSHAQNSLHCHGVTAITPVLEEATGATPLTIIVVSGMDIVLASELGFETSELNPLGFFCVTLGFCDLIDHARIHGRYTPYF